MKDMLRRGSVLFGFALLGLGASPRVGYAATCRDLSAADFHLGGGATVVSLSATDITGGVFTPPGTTTPITNLPPFCRVAMTASSVGNASKSLIAIEAWLPDAGWNGRFVGTGNGGFAGTIDYGSLALRMSEGFAVANSDLGTGLLFKCNSLFCGSKAGSGGIPGGLYGEAAAIRDFGYAAEHLMTIAGKQAAGALYGTDARRSYFAGCSTGGQNALAESQRFPDDYDGILAGAPAHNRTHLHASGIPVYANSQLPSAYLTNAALGLIHSRVLAQCAGHDGGLTTDDFLELPYSCPTDAKTLICHGSVADVPCTDPTAASCTCLTPDQATAMDADWRGARDDLGRAESPGQARGTEEPVPLAAANSYVGNLGLPWLQSGTEPQFDSLFYWIYGPNWRWQSFTAGPSVAPVLSSAALDLTDSLPVGEDTFAGVLNANSTDLAAFAQHGGRMLLYQGYADPLIPSATAIDYYTAVFFADPFRINNYLRLFMAPGVWHCDGGPGANSFGATSQPSPPVPLNPSDDALGALMNWVEKGVGPVRITATKYNNDLPSKGVAFERPLCQYPLHAAYAGGNKLSASSFACVPSFPVLNQLVDAHYGP